MNIVLITSEGYPFQFSANNSKTEFIARGLKEYGCKVTIVDTALGTKGLSNEQAGISQKGIQYYLLPRKGKLTTIFKNLPKLWRILKKEKQAKDNYVILGMTLYPAFVLTAILCMLQGYKRTALFHEWHIGCKQPNIIYKIEAWLKDKTFGYFLNGIFPISHFLLEKGEQFHKPQMILPVMASYDREVHPYAGEYNFTYCGHANYLLRNHLVLDAFKIVIEEYPKAKLILILFGNEKQMQEVRQFVRETSISSIEIKNQIPEEELYKLYDTSLGLLIPLDPSSLQDKARFSQKIAEYIGSKRPIITNNVGEVPYYFTNEKSALIVDYTPEAFAEGMIKLIQRTDLANSIGNEGYNIGIHHFEYHTESNKIANFIRQL